MKQPFDTLYASPRDHVDGFVFDDAVAGVFNDMIHRSVPGYATVLGMLAVFAEQYAQENSRLYDLGCSLGASTAALSQHAKAPGCRVIAVDNAPAMIGKCKANLANLAEGAPVDYVCADIRDVKIMNASVVVLNLTLQFLPCHDRDQIIAEVYAGLNPGGILLMTEKISFDSPEQQRLFTRLHHDFKHANGYSHLEISQKRAALDNVLIPETLDTHFQRLGKSGFTHIQQWFSCLNFTAMLAIK